MRVDHVFPLANEIRGLLRKGFSVFVVAVIRTVPDGALSIVPNWRLESAEADHLKLYIYPSSNSYCGTSLETSA